MGSLCAAERGWMVCPGKCQGKVVWIICLQNAEEKVCYYFYQNQMVLTPLPAGAGMHSVTYRSPPHNSPKHFTGQKIRTSLPGYFSRQTIYNLSSQHHLYAPPPLIYLGHFARRMGLIESKYVHLLYTLHIIGTQLLK